MSNFGVSRLRVVNPFEASYREARSAVGAAEVLKNAEEFSSVAEAVTDCSLVVGTTAARDRELQHSLLDVASGAEKIRGRLAAGNVAVLFGSEKRGLSNADLSHCHWLMHIPTRSEHLSMNLGQSVAICLYEIARSRAIAEAPEKAAANAKELERLTSVLMETLVASEYLKSRASATNTEKIRRLVRRLNLSSEDAELLVGMLRKVNWKLGVKD